MSVLKPELSDVFRDIHSGDTADKWQAARKWKRAGGEKKRGRRVRTFRGLNLGVGVQSTAVYILAHDAALWGPHPLEFAFFADTDERTRLKIYTFPMIPVGLKGIYSSSLEQHNVKAKVLKVENARSTTI